MKTIALAVMLAFSGCVESAPAYAATRGVSNPPNIPIPTNPAGWCTATQLVPGTTKTTQIGDCPGPALTRILRADIKYPNVPGSGIRRNADVTKYAEIWGHANNTDTAVPFPGRTGSVPAVSGWLANHYIAAEFIASSNTRQYVVLGYSQYYSGPALKIVVSEQPGVFTSPNPNCVSVLGSGESAKKIVISPYTNGCQLISGRRYYVNMKPDNGAPWNNFLSTNLSVGNQP